jgi:hypothetical protein
MCVLVRSRVCRRRHLLDQAEIEHLDHVALAADLAQHDVLRLDVAMHQAAGMRFPQRGAGLAQDERGARRRHRPVALDQVGQREAFEILHGIPEFAAGPGAVIVDGDGVGVVPSRW